MKSKLDNNKLKCKICGRKFGSNKGLANHVGYGHKIKIKDYYDKFLKKENEGKCKTCGKKTNFRNVSLGYRSFCTIHCSRVDPEVIEKTKLAYLKHYGVDNPSKALSVRKKTKQTCLNRYGVKCIFQSKDIRRKAEQTCLKRYGVKCSFQSKECREKTKQTSLKNCGYDHWTKSPQGRKLNREKNIKQIETQKLNGEPLTPTIGKNERLFLNELQKYCKYKITRNIKLESYYPDGLVKEIKLDIEFDEKHHNRKKIALHDAIRDEYFKSLGYTIFRIKEFDWKENKVKAIEQFKLIVQNIIQANQQRSQMPATKQQVYSRQSSTKTASS